MGPPPDQTRPPDCWGWASAPTPRHLKAEGPRGGSLGRRLPPPPPESGRLSVQEDVSLGWREGAPGTRAWSPGSLQGDPSPPGE